MRIQRLAAALGSILLPAAAFSQWSTDPSANNPIADGPSDQILCKPAAAPDGGVVVIVRAGC